MSDCNNALDDLYGYLDQEVSRYRRWRIRRHLRICEGCDNAFVFEQRLQVVVRQCLKEDVPPEFLARLRQSLHSDR